MDLSQAVRRRATCSGKSGCLETAFLESLVVVRASTDRDRSMRCLPALEQSVVISSEHHPVVEAPSNGRAT